MEFISDNRIKVDPPKKPKKLTATRFATVLGLNAWSTPFEAWCAITRTYEEPFEDTIYTKAGKVIEPKVIEYLNDVMFMDIKSPTDVYGPDYFKKTWGDFFPDWDALGGMWDALGDDFVVEIKTTKRAEDWATDVPIYYKLQAALYAYLLGFDNIVMTASFLEDKDYANPELFEPSYKNTKVYEFKLSEAFPDFETRYVKPALAFWTDHVMTGISPEYDEKKDAEILKVLRKNTVEPDDKGISKLIAEADRIQAAIDKAEAKLEEKKSRLKEIDSIVKKYMSGQFRDGDKKVEIAGKKYTWTLTRTVRKSVDNAALKADGVYEKYLRESETLTLKKSAIEEAS
jgi:predicted phage-related endonuclease